MQRRSAASQPRSYCSAPLRTCCSGQFDILCIAEATSASPAQPLVAWSSSDSLRAAVGLSDTSGFHPKKRRETSLEHKYRERQPHIFRARRAQGNAAADDFTTGQQELQRSNGERIRTFLERTTRDHGSYRSVNSQDEAGQDDEMGREGSPLDGVEPSRVVDGIVRLGDEEEQ